MKGNPGDAVLPTTIPPQHNATTSDRLVDEILPEKWRPNPDELFLELKGIKKSFGLKPVLRKIDLTLKRGDSLALLGANGAGKSTLLRLLACLTTPSGGKILLDGLESPQDAQEMRYKVGLVAHDPFVYEELTALENLLFFGRLYGVANAKARGQELLRQIGLERKMGERVGTFSRGMLQRLAWARALLHRPQLLLLDEPETGLDQEGERLMIALLEEHKGCNGSVIFTTHQLERAKESSERLAILQAGRIVFQQDTRAITLEELRKTYQEVVK